MRNFQIVVTIFVLLLAACGGGGGESPGGGSSALLPSSANSPAATGSVDPSSGYASTVQISGQITGVASGVFLLQTGEPHGYIDVYNNASTVISGSAPFVGEYVLVIGTGSLSTSITAISVTQKSSVDAPAPIAKPDLSTAAGPVVALGTNGLEIDSRAVGHLWVDTNANTAFFGGKPTIGEYQTVAGSGSFEGTYTATAASQTSAAPASTTVSGVIIAGRPYGFTLYVSSTYPSVPIVLDTSSLVTGATLEVGAIANVTGPGSASGSILATNAVVVDYSTTAATPTPTSQPVATATLPPQGVYNSCEIDTALTTMCEQEDAALTSDGYKWELDYIGLMAHKTGPQSLQAWFTYDASIGIGQIIAVNSAINDPVNVLTGTRLATLDGDTNLASDCAATNNEQVIACVYAVASAVPGFHWKWYAYDEPGCPNQAIGFCQGTLAGGNYNNVATLAQYIHSIDPMHPVIGTEVGDMGNQTVVNTEFSWLLSAASPVTGFDHYPIPENAIFGQIDDIGTIAGELANTIAADYSPEQMYYVGQAFSWYQESGKGCTSISACPYPTTAQMQAMRDQALYYANKAGKPMSMILWYYWPDVTCMNSYSGCNATANRASLKAAAFAPFPATPPP